MCHYKAAEAWKNEQANLLEDEKQTETKHAHRASNPESAPERHATCLTRCFARTWSGGAGKQSVMCSSSDPTSPASG